MMSPTEKYNKSLNYVLILQEAITIVYLKYLRIFVFALLFGRDNKQNYKRMTVATQQLHPSCKCFNAGTHRGASD